MASWVLGVDLGTTTTLAALSRHEPGRRARPRLIDLAEDGPAMGSAVVVEDLGDRVEIHVGDEAARRSPRASDHRLANPRNHLGEDVWDFGTHRVAIVDLVAAQLRHVIGRATSATGGRPPRELVLTHPAHWTDHRPSRLEAAARQAYAGPVRFVAEPVAVAAAYAGRARTLCVIDVGAGSTDVSLVERGTSPRLLAHGEVTVGGNHVDAALIRDVLDELRAADRDDLADDLVAERNGPAMFELREGVRRARLALATCGSGAVPVTVRSDDGGVTVSIAAERLASLTGALAVRVATQARAVTQRAGVPLTDVGAVVLTGGASQLPGLAGRLSSALGRDIEALPHPEAAVVLGALAPGAAHSDSPVTTPGDATPGDATPGGGAHPYGARRRSRAGSLVAITAALALIVVAVVAFMRPWERPQAPSARPPAMTTVTPTPEDTSDPPTEQELADRVRLSALVSRDEKDCEFDDQPGPAGELVQMTCPHAVDLGDRSGWVTYTLFADEAQAAAQLLDLGVDESARCPAPGVGPYETQGRRGRVACMATASAVFWQESGTPVVAGYTAPGVALEDLYLFWTRNNRL